MLQAAPRVLVVDDDPTICDLIEAVLADEGWSVRTRTHGREALACLREWAAELILLDVVIPDVDAEEFLARAREQGMEDTPIVLMSAATNLGQHAARLGVLDTLAKPFDIDDLCATVRRLIDRGQAVRVAGAAHGR